MSATRWSGAPTLAISVALGIATLAFRGSELGRPGTFVFDEVFYANDALDLYVNGAELTRVGHPPLGKWLISIGYLSGSFSPATWRIAALVAGALVIVIVFALAKHLTRSVLAGLCAALLVLTDGIAHTMGRYAFLDGFVALFTVLLLAIVVVTRARSSSYGQMALVGLVSGAALATKWSALPAVAVAMTVIAMRASRGTRSMHAASLVAAALGTCALTYFASYAPWIVTGADFGSCTNDACDEGPLERLQLLPVIQREMLTSNVDFEQPTPQFRPGWHWLTQDRPMRIFHEDCRGQDDGVCRQRDRHSVIVEFIGNRVLWWSAALVGIAWIVLRVLGQRMPPGVALSLAWSLALWAPWIVRDAYLFYAAPIVPSLAVGLTVGVAPPEARAGRRILLVTMTIAAAALFGADRIAAPWNS